MKPKIFLIFILAVLLIAVLIIIKRNNNPATGDTNALMPTAASGEILDGAGSVNSKFGDCGKITDTTAFLEKTASHFLAGGSKWTLVYSDQSLPELHRKRINYDLSLIFGHLPEVEIDTLYQPIKLADGRELDRRARFEGGTRSGPAMLSRDDGFSCLFRGGSESEIFVPKSVSDAYVEALKLEEQNVAAFKELDLFLQRMTELKAQPVTIFKDLLVGPEVPQRLKEDWNQADASGFTKAWGGKVYRDPSILEVGPATGYLEKYKQYGDLFAKTYCVNGNELQELPPLVFKGGKWRFLMLPQP